MVCASERAERDWGGENSFITNISLVERLKEGEAIYWTRQDGTDQTFHNLMRVRE
jgi:hypothetical protein